jgi:hypothetical protein
LIGFNLVTQEWIKSPVGLISLADVFNRAPDLESIHGDTPIQTSALHQLCLVVLQATYRGMDEEKWMEIWTRGTFSDEVTVYLRKWIERFELFSEVHPFMQDPTLHLFVKGDESVSSLFQHYPSGADALLNTSTNEWGDVIVTAEEAARALVTTQMYGIGGTKGRGVSFTDSHSTRQSVFLALGENLFETLMLNLIPYPLEVGNPDWFPQTDHDCPIWERDPDSVFDDTGRPAGFLDYLTYPNRRIQLVPINSLEGVKVQRMYYSLGLRFYIKGKENAARILHPFSRYYEVTIKKKDKNEVYLTSYKRKMDRDTWRDLPALIELYAINESKNMSRRSIPPLNLAWVKYLAAKGTIPLHKSRRLGAYDQITEPGRDKVYNLTVNIVPLPTEYLADELRHTLLAAAMDYASQVEYNLIVAMKVLATYQINPDLKDLNAVFASDPHDLIRDARVASWGTKGYWNSLHNRFLNLVDTIAKDGPCTEHLKSWKDDVKAAAIASLSSFTQSDLTARSLRAGSSAESFLRYRLRKIDILKGEEN